MGNDNEIKNLIKRESEFSLSKTLKDIEVGKKAYVLEEEFAKTKKNRSKLPFAVIGAATALFIGGALIANAFIQSGIRNAEIDIDSFQDVNLRDLLDVVKKNAQDMDLALRELARVETERDSELKAADDEFESASRLLKTQDLDPAEMTRRLGGVARARDAKKAETARKFAPPIAAKKAEIAEIQKRIDLYDVAKMDEANKQKEILDNQAKVFEMEKAELKAFYERRIAEIEARSEAEVRRLERQRDELVATLARKHEGQIRDLVAKYNPSLADGLLASLVANSVVPPSRPRPPEVPSALVRDGILTEAEAARMSDTLAEYLKISGFLRSVPYVNSVPYALASMENRAWELTDMGSEYLGKSSAVLAKRAGRIAELESTLARREKSLERYSFALASLLATSRESGYVIDPRDGATMTVYLNPVYPVADGSRGWVFRDDEKLVGTVIFSRSGSETTAKIETLAADAEVRPFDRIMLNLAEEGLPGESGGNQ